MHPELHLRVCSVAQLARQHNTSRLLYFKYCFQKFVMSGGSLHLTSDYVLPKHSKQAGEAFGLLKPCNAACYISYDAHIFITAEGK